MERKIVELDARPSDCLALVVRCGAPIFVVKELWDSLEDMTPVLREMKDKANPQGPQISDDENDPGIF